MHFFHISSFTPVQAISKLWFLGGGRSGSGDTRILDLPQDWIFEGGLREDMEHVKKEDEVSIFVYHLLLILFITITQDV